jgi:hypothetical protein
LELFGNLVVGYVFPDKIHQLHYLFILLPGMMAVTISGAFGFILYITLHYKAILWNNIFSLLSYIGILGFMLQVKIFTLENVAYAKSIQNGLVLVFLLVVFLLSKKRIDNYYYLNKVESKLDI